MTSLDSPLKVGEFTREARTFRWELKADNDLTGTYKYRLLVYRREPVAAGERIHAAAPWKLVNQFGNGRESTLGCQRAAKRIAKRYLWGLANRGRTFKSGQFTL